MFNVLITGGAGFIGSHLSERLLKEECEVTCVDNFDAYYDPTLKRVNIKNCLKDPRFKLIELDICDEKALKGLFNTYVFDTVVHLAARPGTRASIQQSKSCIDVNIRGTLNLLEELKDSDIKNLIFGSTSSVYGNNKNIPFSENDPSDKPASPYAASKRSCELLCYTYSHLYGVPVTCLRFFTVYGPRQRPDMVIHKFIRLIDQDMEIPVFGDGSSSRDYTYISDMIDGILNALNKKFEYEIFNLGNSKPIELQYLISLIEEKFSKKAKIKRLPFPKSDSPITCADISKARRLLNYDPKVTIEDGIERFVRWYRTIYS